MIVSLRLQMTHKFGEKWCWRGAYLERERLLLSCLRREGLGEPEELLELELRDVLELPERLDADEELEPLLEPVLVLEPELEVELDRDLRSEMAEAVSQTTSGSNVSSQHKQARTMLPRVKSCSQFSQRGKHLPPHTQDKTLRENRKQHSHRAVTKRKTELLPTDTEALSTKR